MSFFISFLEHQIFGIIAQQDLFNHSGSRNIVFHIGETSQKGKETVWKSMEIPGGRGGHPMQVLIHREIHRLQIDRFGQTKVQIKLEIFPKGFHWYAAKTKRLIMAVLSYIVFLRLFKGFFFILILIFLQSQGARID